jgi:L-cysteate sulfo-lyase
MQHPRYPLGFIPTPVVPLERLSAFLAGPKLYIKRDDQTGLALGGNKTRKLEFLLGEALAQGCDMLVTGGAVQSNHCRQTAAAAAVAGLRCTLLLSGAPVDEPDGNLLLDNLLGAKIHWDSGHRKGEGLEELAEKLRMKGQNPFLIPYGGSNATGALGYVEMAGELAEQIRTSGFHFDHIVFASSSGGTQAGLMVGKEVHSLKARIHGICIDKHEGEELPYRETVRQLAEKTAKKCGVEILFTEHDIILHEGYEGEGYGIVGDLEREAIGLMARLEGILLDPVYTGRAMGALIDLIGKNHFSKNEQVLFIHTGGAPALFPYRKMLMR